jgi:hypothetical protein
MVISCTWGLRPFSRDRLRLFTEHRCLPPIELPVATASPLWVAGPPPWLTLSASNASSHACTHHWPVAVVPTHALQLCQPLGPYRRCTQLSSPSTCTNILGYHHVASLGVGCHVPARSSSRNQVLLHILRVPLLRLYRLPA